MKAQIAQFLKVSEAQIIRIEEWANVFFVVVKGKGGRFVSKKVVRAEIKMIQPIVWKIEAECRRQERKFWVARLTGQDEKWVFARQFITASEVEWGKCGMKKAWFELDAPGYYQDCDGDYIKVWVDENGEFDAEVVSKLEVQHHFYAKQPV